SQTTAKERTQHAWGQRAARKTGNRSKRRYLYSCCLAHALCGSLAARIFRMNGTALNRPLLNHEGVYGVASARRTRQTTSSADGCEVDRSEEIRDLATAEARGQGIGRQF